MSGVSHLRGVRTERATYFWGACGVALACVIAAGILRLSGLGLAVGPVVVRWYLLALGAVFATVLMPILARRTWVQVIGAVAMTPLVLAVGLAGLTLLAFGGIPSLPIENLVAPDNRPYAAVVRESRDLIDPIYDVSIDGIAPVGPSWHIACVNGDYQELVDLRWRSPEELVVAVDSGDGPTAVSVRVDPALGRPVGPLPELLDNC